MQIKNELQKYGGGFNAFIQRAHKEDVQRQNLFQVFFTKIPDVVIDPNSVNARYSTSGATGILQNIGNAVNSVVNRITSNPLGSALASFGYDLARKHGVFRKVYGIFQPGAIDTIFGTLATGNLTALGDYSKMQETNIAVHNIQLPASEINYEPEENHRLKQISPQTKSEQKFSVTFKNFSSNRDYVYFKSWVDSVIDEYGYQNFLEDIETNIIVYTHDRNGQPTSVHYLYGCVPIQVQALEFQYETSDVSTFTVDFFVRHHKVNNVGISKKQYSQTIDKLLSGLL